MSKKKQCGQSQEAGVCKLLTEKTWLAGKDDSCLEAGGRQF